MASREDLHFAGGGIDCEAKFELSSRILDVWSRKKWKRREAFGWVSRDQEAVDGELFVGRNRRVWSLWCSGARGGREIRQSVVC